MGFYVVVINMFFEFLLNRNMLYDKCFNGVVSFYLYARGG